MSFSSIYDTQTYRVTKKLATTPINRPTQNTKINQLSDLRFERLVDEQLTK